MHLGKEGQRMRKKHDNSSLIMLLAAMNANLERLTGAVQEVGQHLQKIEKDLFELRLDTIRNRGKENGQTDEQGKQN